MSKAAMQICWGASLTSSTRSASITAYSAPPLRLCFFSAANFAATGRLICQPSRPVAVRSAVLNSYHSATLSPGRFAGTCTSTHSTWGDSASEDVQAESVRICARCDGRGVRTSRSECTLV